MQTLVWGLERTCLSFYAGCKSGLVSFGGHVADHFLPHARNHYTPHIIHHRALTLLTLLAIVLKVGIISITTLEPAYVAESSAITQVSVLDLTNQARTAAGISSLSRNALLEAAAQAKAEDMASKGYFAHVAPDGREPWDFIRESGYSFASAGENLAVHFFDVEPLQEAWMNSPGHRANVLNSGFTEMGIGIAKGKFENYDTVFVVEMFGSPQVAKASAPQQLETERVTLKLGPVELSPQSASAAESLDVQDFPSSPEVVVTEDTTESMLEKNTFSLNKEPEIYEINTNIEQENLNIEVTTNDKVANITLENGDKGVMFSPLSQTTWRAVVKLANLAPGSVVAKAVNLNGDVATKQVMIMSDVEPAYGLVKDITTDSKYKIFNREVNLDSMEKKVGLGLIALVLTVILVSVLRHWRFHHLKVYANASFAVIFISLMLVW